MGFLGRLFGSKPAPQNAAKGEEHAVLLHIKLGDTWPSEEERRRYFGLQDELKRAIERAGAGELDGDEWGGGECVIFMYGPDADGLWEAIAPVLEKHEFPRGSTAIKRYGGPDCTRVETIKIEWEG